VSVTGNKVSDRRHKESVTRLTEPVSVTKYLISAALSLYDLSLRPFSPMPEPPTLSLDAVQSTLGSAARWAILRELADGSSLMVSELADRARMSSSAVSKQLNALVSDGIVIHPRGRLYEIAPQFLTDKTERILDFGYCLLRLNIGSEDA
jgi:DNA-binding transcriptional ArsR family regulator